MPRHQPVLEDHPAGPMGAIDSRDKLGTALAGEFAAHVVELMWERGLSQRQLALAVGRARGTVACWLTGRREPCFADFFRLAKALGVSPASLWSGMAKGFR